jgi:hypothetical protein
MACSTADRQPQGEWQARPVVKTFTLKETPCRRERRRARRPLHLRRAYGVDLTGASRMALLSRHRHSQLDHGCDDRREGRGLGPTDPGFLDRPRWSGGWVTRRSLIGVRSTPACFAVVEAVALEIRKPFQESRLTALARPGEISETPGRAPRGRPKHYVACDREGPARSP